MSHRSVACPASIHAGNLGMIATAIAMPLGQAAVAGAIAVRQAREARASQVLSGHLSAAMVSLNEWVDFAKNQAKEIERLKAENARLTRVSRDQHADLVELSKRIAK
jgi:hypothetical protein